QVRSSSCTCYRSEHGVENSAGAGSHAIPSSNGSPRTSSTMGEELSPDAASVLDFIARLAALVPQPRAHLTRLCAAAHRRVYAESDTPVIRAVPSGIGGLLRPREMAAPE